MVSYTITMSMALIFARKLLYEVDSNQELLALVSILTIINHENSLVLSVQGLPLLKAVDNQKITKKN